MPAVDETTLLGQVTMLVVNTGHYHLVGTQVSGGDTVPDFSVDAGAVAYINKAVRWWDRQSRHARKLKKTTVELAAGDVQITVAGFFSIKSMRVVTETCPLVQADEGWLHENVGADLEAVDAVETPKYWARALKAPNDVDEVFWILPPSGSDETIEVVGYAYTAALADDADTNWWLTNWPEAVLYVAQQLVNDNDMNPYTNSTLKQLVNDVQTSVWSDDIAEEIAFYGKSMAG